ncbi:WXG100 family type VII secretion target [Cellulomonas sp. CW35]|uniref:Uncharacterized protein n=1 Tax=Cellulomonas uda TaxID=1714 RepID=A0A4Y3KE40_CELUD|nr:MULTISPECIES: hypothetical protein [Cellulomonas]ASR56068.1 hypothetical protein CBP52_14280 [Cellulomonas sp. PSBB021]NII66292.1 uncharacterized protein YukE [Cellulomonas uda]GEA81906.1 hypothetical protein CUD01_23500 [Cellulomonas uda]
MTSAADALVTPVASAPIPDFVDLALHFPDLISPSYWLMWVIEQVSGTNPLEWVTEHFSGDWEAMSRAASALEHLATFHQQYASELAEARATFREGWDGNAAAAASRYFTELESAVREQGTPLTSIAHEVDVVAQGMKSTQTMLVGLLQALLDYAIAAAISAAAAAASSWTVVGGILGGGATAFSITQAVRTWLKVIEVHGYAITAVDGVVGVTAGYLGSIHGFSTHPLPAGAYDNPGV